MASNGTDRFESLAVSAVPSAIREAEFRRIIESLRVELRAAQSGRRQALMIAQARSDFIATTSHELRTPLNAIIGFSEVMSAEMFGPLGNERYREYADIIHRSGKGLLSLINDLLDISKLDAGKLELHFAPVEVLKVIVECVRGVEVMANKSRVGITVNVFDGIDSLEADDKRLRQMLLNLLSNAVKFTHEGGAVCISAFRRGDCVAIEVSDTGIGMADEDIPKVLEPFGQIESDLSGKHDGTGLGLPLTKELAERHGGSLSIESAIGVGTIMTILLPAASRHAH